MYDIIGDIHGHAEQLRRLLLKLGYTKRSDTYVHPERKVLFVGDYIDRGPNIPETLRLVKDMVNSGNATALMGNHEYNAVCFNIKHPTGGYLRDHSIKNIAQHNETLMQFKKSPSDYDDFLEWFTTLPLTFEDKHFRAVHACWDQESINGLDLLKTEAKSKTDLFSLSSDHDAPYFEPVDITLKGKEVSLPTRQFFHDKDGHKRSDIRIKWWVDPTNKLLDDLSIPSGLNIGDAKFDPEAPVSFYSPTDKPVFFGHYWLQGIPTLQSHNVCCLDFSVAKGGYLTAYRYQGEKVLTNEHLVYIK